MSLGSVVNETTAVVLNESTDDTFGVAWILVCTFLIISMQLGFAMLEVGSVREAHRMTVLVKNIMDSCASSIAFWAYCEYTRPSLVTRDNILQFHLVLFHWAFCTTSVTICSGSMAERTHMLAYLTFAMLMAGVIYPVMADSAWGDGIFHSQFQNRWHDGYRYHDFAGSGVVHVMGGASALVGNMMLGRRIMRPEQDKWLSGVERREHASVQDSSGVYGARRDFDRSAPPRVPATVGQNLGHHGTMETDLNDLEEQDLQEEMLLRPEGGWPRRFDDSTRDEDEFRPLQYLQVTGMFTLWVGWYGFNAGSTLSIDKQAAFVAGIISWNTTMAAAAGGLGAYLCCCIFRKSLDVSFIANGVLIGLVSITASCDVVTPGASAVIGLTAGFIIYPLSSLVMQLSRLDDPVDAVPVHLVGGLFGVVATSFCHPDCELLMEGGGGQDEQVRFCMVEHSVGRQLVAQAWGALMELGLAMGSFWVVFGLFAISERTRAQEVELLIKAEELLCQMVTPEPHGARALAEWGHIVTGSPLARRVLRRHGFANGNFRGGAPHDLWRLRLELRQARGDSAETALEKEGVCACLGKLASRCRPFRSMALLRLRIAPAAELSGLGAAQADGGRMFNTVREVMLHAVKVREENNAHSPLKREVAELTLQLQSQQALIDRLSRRSFRWRNRGGLHSVPERRESGNSSDQGAAEDTSDGERPPEVETTQPYEAPPALPAELATLEAPTVQAPQTLPMEPTLSRSSTGTPRTAEGHSLSSPRRQAPSSQPLEPRQPQQPPAAAQIAASTYGRSIMSSANSDSTVEERSTGALSVHSNADSTPPPSMGAAFSRQRPAGGAAYGQQHHPGARYMVPQIPAAGVSGHPPVAGLPLSPQDAANAQVLYNLLLAQQRLLSAVQVAAPGTLQASDLSGASRAIDPALLAGALQAASLGRQTDTMSLESSNFSSRTGTSAGTGSTSRDRLPRRSSYPGSPDAQGRVH